MSTAKNGFESLTNFNRETPKYLTRLKKSGEPLVLTVKGKAELVVIDPATYQELVDEATASDKEQTLAAIREGLADLDAGRMVSAEEAFAELAQRTGLKVRRGFRKT